MSEQRKYKIIYADPPWKYKVWSGKGTGRTADNHYETQELDFLCKLNVSALSDQNSVLLMWATFPCLLQAFKLGAAWGFTYKTVAFTWVKQNKCNSRPFLGLGYYTRANAEIVLLFTKGKPLPRSARDVPQVLISPRSTHSQKPGEIRERINRLFGDLPRVELFARSIAGVDHAHQFKGWDVFGNEVNHSISISNDGI